jgi:hypothetical protein
MSQPRILIVGAQHGDERLGPRLDRFLKNDKSGRYENIDYLCGNPRALRRNIRFTETDLNRSYGFKRPKTYEQKRAQKILRLIKAGNYDYVLDIHTSRADVGRFFLATHLDGAVKKIIAASSFEKIVLMPQKIAECSLIGQVPQAISIEYERRLSRSQRTLSEIKVLLGNLLSGNSVAKQQREVYFVDRTIPLRSAIDDRAENFRVTQQGFYPVIFSRNGSYKTHRGFAASKKHLISM